MHCNYVYTGDFYENWRSVYPMIQQYPSWAVVKYVCFSLHMESILTFKSFEF